MPQLFRIGANTVTKIVIISFIGLVCGSFGVGEILKWSSYVTDVGVPREQPIPFSHRHHVKGDGIDCRYCHTSVEISSTAGMPSTETCMTCHSQIWSQSPLLKPVQASFFENKPLHWTRVHVLPDYVYFNHSIHINKGIGCVSCHGQVDEMPLNLKIRTFYMRDCLSCHRNPERYIRPREEVFNLHWKPPTGEKERNQLGKQLIQQYQIDKERITNCYTCHR